MTFTGQLGTSNSSLGSVELGVVAATTPAVVAVYAREIRQGPPLRGAPWTVRLYVEPAAVQASAFVPPARPLYAAEIQQGPPLRGAPWARRIIHEQRLQQASTFLAAPSLKVYAPEIQFGPPMRGAPWLRHRLPWTEEGQLRGSVILPGNRGGQQVLAAALPLLGRVPRDADPRRLGRLTEELISIINSLIAQGLLVQTGPKAWKLVGLGGSGLTGTFTDGTHP